MPVKRKRNRKRTTKPTVAWPQINWSRVVSSIAALIVVASGYVGTLWLMDRPIERVVINGKFERVSAIQLEELLAPHLSAGFLSADLRAMRVDPMASERFPNDVLELDGYLKGESQVFLSRQLSQSRRPKRRQLPPSQRQKRNQGLTLGRTTADHCNRTGSNCTTG